MKKLLGIMVLVALMAGPAMAADPVNVPVEITVLEYSEITQPDDLVMNVTAPWKGTGDPPASEGLHEATAGFTVTSNAPCTLTITVPYGEATGYKTIVDGQPTADPAMALTTAWLNDPTPKVDGIGYGLSVSGCATTTGWVGDIVAGYGVVGDGSLVATYIAGATDSTIKINKRIAIEN